MAQITVGVRELKQGLSHYLRQVAEGNTVLITDRGRPVGQIVPVKDENSDRLRQLVELGLIEWSGRKLAHGEPVAKNESDVSVADLLIEDRE